MPFAHAPLTDDAWAALLGPAMDAMSEGVLVHDATGTIRAANTSAKRIIGVADDLAGHGQTGERHRPLHPSGRPMSVEEQPVSVALATGEPQYDVVVQLERDDAPDVWLTVNAVPLFDQGGDRPFGVIATFSDITASIEAQERLADRERDLSLLAEHAGDLIALHDADGRIVRAAGGAEALLGVPARHLTGFWAGDICHADDLPGIERAHALAREGRASTISYRVNHFRDGREIWLESTISPRHDQRGGFVDAVTTTRDITERKADEQRLREAEERARAQHELLEQAQAMADLGSWVWDPADDTVWWSAGALRIFGVDEADADSRAHDRLIHPADREAVRAALWSAARDGRRFEHTYRLVRPDGSERIMSGRGRPSGPARNGLHKVAGTTQDVTEVHALQASRREAEERFRTAFEHAPIGICIVSAAGPGAGQWIDVNPAMGELLGWDREELLARPLRDFVHPDDREMSRDALRDLASRVQSRISVEARLLHRDGQVLWTLVTATAVTDEEGRPAQAVLQVVDITERKRFEGQLQHLADHDTLTGLFNRRRFEEELDRVLAAAERYGRAGAVVVLDLDGFKYVNDTLGHRAGDQLMARLATTLRAELRESDVIARLGGDEFGIILPEATTAQAVEVAGKVLRAVERDGIVATDARHARVTASAGVAPFDGTDGLSAEELLVEADVAMYDAKEDGRNRTVVHERDPVVTGAGRHASRLSWLERIRRALVEDRFELHAQPIVALAGDDVPAFELLIRMRTEDGDVIGPAAFLPVAERFDVIGDIDRWVVRQAVTLLRREHAAGRDVTLSVNVSGRTVSDEAFAGWLEDLLVREPVPAGRLIAEITETAAIVNLERARALGDTLRRLGCRLALDDFGSGFTSFSYLKHLRFDVLKIDGEFVRGLRDNPTDRLVVEAVVAIARGLGTPSLAEFVGDSDTLDAVRAMGIDYAQGFHLGRPEPVEEALRLARSGVRPSA